MSTPYPRDRLDPYSLIPFDDQLLDQAVEAAQHSPRKRHIIRLHEHEEAVQRMLNAIEPESYARPHRHADRPETLVAMRGSVLVARFADDGTPVEGVVASAAGPVRGVEIPPGAWHGVIALQHGSVVFEVTLGPYDPATHKEFADWAPPEQDRQAGLEYIARLRAQFEVVLPKLAAIDQIEAEEDEIC
jgi:cupin fold WbuC family metalloprotein